MKENRRTGKVKHIRRRVSSCSTASNPNGKPTTPEDTQLWNSLIKRQSKLLECIKRGEKGKIPAIVELPEIIDLDVPKSEVIDCDPLSIDDSSYEENPTFQDYCLKLYRFEDTDDSKDSFSQSEGSQSIEAPVEPPVRGEEGSECDDPRDNSSSVSSACDDEDKGDEIATMITEPLMEWDLEHDGIFEV